MATYTYKCSNPECTYKHKINYNFEPTFNDVCNICGKELVACLKSEVEAPKKESASLVSGVGEIYSKNGGANSDWNSLMRKIKKGSPNCNMRDY